MKFDNITRHFHPAGWPFIGIFAAVTVLLGFVGLGSFVIGALLTAWCFYFFRDPSRTTPQKAGLIVSPADGVVVAVKQVTPEADLGLGSEPRTRISIFLNVFDVHVNRIPTDSTVVARLYRKGTFVNASLDKASKDNERMALVLKLTGEHPKAGQTMGLVQIAGLIARRILCDAKQGDAYQAGARYGIIRFGSRADIYLPLDTQPLVAVGQYMIGGETILADCTSTEPARIGAQRE